MPEHKHVINDGPLFARTYKYFLEDGKYVFEKQEKYNIDFLGEEWVMWEEYTMGNYLRNRLD